MVAGARSERIDPVVTKKKLWGTESRWRRFGEPTAAGPGGGSNADHGVFGPGSVAWEVLLSPATIVFQSAAQIPFQLTYKPIAAGVRDWDPISRKARKGELTAFDVFDRIQRNSGIHAPMWLGDSGTATRVAKHMNNIHAKVAGDIIDVGEPEIGGYAANSPRDSMWAALTEMHSMLWLYETLAFRGSKLPQRLPAHLRDRFISEVAEYCRIFPAAAEDLPHSMADLENLYQRDAALFGHSESIDTLPETGENLKTVLADSMKKNRHWSQYRVYAQLLIQTKLFELPVLASFSGKTRRSMGVSRRKERIALVATKLGLPLIWLVQRPPIERYFMRMMWGPDAVALIKSARALHAEALRNAPLF
ncbi:oxygenase MpaB family protein [Rhodococcus sp. NPDC057135]|uniref:oxygenase MpaB family protein n=1 Tax=Rhodococcus sp. NPDC057135 TaxID=3346028 RepID=UPI00362BF283